MILLNLVLEKTLESPLESKEIKPANPKGNQSWIFIGRTDADSNTLATPWEELTHLKRPWCWEGLGAGEEGDDRGWDGWMASLTWWTWVWVNSTSWWWTGRPGVLWFMGSQRVGHDWATELNWILPQIPLLSRLAHKIEQSSMCYTVSFCWLSILNIAVCTWPSQSP